MKRRWILKVVRMALLAALFVSLVSAGVMLLWNALIPSIFGAAPITWCRPLDCWFSSESWWVVGVTADSGEADGAADGKPRLPI